MLDSQAEIFLESIKLFSHVGPEVARKTVQIVTLPAVIVSCLKRAQIPLAYGTAATRISIL